MKSGEKLFFTFYRSFYNVSADQEFYLWDEYFFCVLCTLGAITSLINLSVFLHPNLKDPIYKFYIASSILDFMYGTIIAFIIFILCGTLCEKLRSTTLATQVFWLVFDDYLTSCFAITNIFIELFLSLQRLFMITNKTFLQNLNPNKVLIFLCVIGLVYYIPVLFVRKIVKFDLSFANKTGYGLEQTDFGKSDLGRTFPVILSTIRLVIASIVLFSINVVSLIKFKNHINKKKSLTKAAKTS